MLVSSLVTTTEKQAPVQMYKAPQLKESAFLLGEKLTFRVHYGFLTAGEANFEVDWNTKMINGKPCYQFKGFGASASSFDWFYHVRDTFTNTVEKESMLPLNYKRVVHEGTYHFSDQVNFDHSSKSVTSKKGKYKITPQTHDILSALYSTRQIDLGSLEIGKVYQVDIWLDNELYKLGWKILGKETIKTELGKFKAIKVRPIVVADRVFKDSEGMSIWVTDDKNHLPLRIESPVIVGSVKADLKSYKYLKYPLTSKIRN